MKTKYFSIGKNSDPLKELVSGVFLEESLKNCLKADVKWFSKKETKELSYYKVTIEEVEKPDATRS